MEKTTPPLHVMNKMMKFYSLLLAYIEATVDSEEDRNVIMGCGLLAHPSWEVTHESLIDLEVCVNRPSEVDDDDHSFQVAYDHLVAAFRDLSVIKNPDAMELFHRIARRFDVSYGPGKDHVVWARKVVERPDGSAVIILHVSDLAAARQLIEQHDHVDSSQSVVTLENGILFME